MRTAKETFYAIHTLGPAAVPKHLPKYIYDAMKEYAKEAIKLDRAWVAENAKINQKYYSKDENPKEFDENKEYWDCRIDSYGEYYAVSVYEVDINSILNAPQIELL